VHDAVVADEDGVDRAHLGARGDGIDAVHAHRREGGGGVAAVEEVEVHHRLAAVGVALPAGGHAGAAGDAAGGVDEDGSFHRHGVGSVWWAAGTGGGGTGHAGSFAGSRRTAAVLKAGIQLLGSKRAIVSWLAATGPLQW
jgi:hypothetical protein